MLMWNNVADGLEIDSDEMYVVCMKQIKIYTFFIYTSTKNKLAQKRKQMKTNLLDDERDRDRLEWRR